MCILKCSFHGFAMKCLKMKTVKSERWLNLTLKRKRVEIQKKNLFKTFSFLLRWRPDYWKLSVSSFPLWAFNTSAERDTIVDAKSAWSHEEPHNPALLSHPLTWHRIKERIICIILYFLQRRKNGWRRRQEVSNFIFWKTKDNNLCLSKKVFGWAWSLVNKIGVNV